MNRRHWFLVPLVVLVAAAVLTGSVAFALDLPATRVLFRGAQGSPDYRVPQPNGLNGLRSDYIAQILGLSPRPHDGAAATGSLSSGTDAGGLASLFDHGASPRVVVNHPFDNDDFGHAREISSVPFTARTDTTHASRQDGEPSDCAAVGGTAWYRYEPPGDVSVLVDTFGTGYADALGIYTGSSLANLRSVGCNTGATGNAELRLELKAGATYYVQVTGPVRGGHLVLNIDAVGPTVPVMVSSTGKASDQPTTYITPVSADGRYVAFASDAIGLAPGATCPVPDNDWYGCSGIFLKDMRTGRLRIVTWSLDEPDRDCCIPWPGGVSGDGRYVTFETDANIIPGYRKTTATVDVYTFDRVTGRIELDSVSSSGARGTAPPPGRWVNGRTGAWLPSISADGRYVTFESDYTNLVSHDTNGVGDVFVHDRITGRTTRVSVRSDGGQLNNWSDLTWGGQGISASGRFVVFTSSATNIGTNASGCTSGCYQQVFLRDRRTGRVIQISRPRSGGPDGSSSSASVSGDGRHVAFLSNATNLVPGDTNGTADYFEWAGGSDKVIRVSVSSAGEQQRGALNSSRTSFYGQQNAGTTVTLSADGRFTCFESTATNLVNGASAGFNVTYVHDRLTGATTLGSVTAEGAPQGRNAFRPVMSADGRHVVFDLDRNGNFVQDWTAATPGQVLEHWLP